MKWRSIDGHVAAAEADQTTEHAKFRALFRSGWLASEEIIAEPENPFLQKTSLLVLSANNEHSKGFLLSDPVEKFFGGDHDPKTLRAMEQIQAAIDRAPVPIYVKDLQLRYLLANRVAHEILGLEPGEMIGRTDSEMVSPESEVLIREGDMRVLRSGEPCERELTVTLAGSERTFLSVRFPYLDQEGELAGVTGVSTDITAQRQAEQLQRDLGAARERSIEELRSSRQETVERLARAIEMHDAETGRHVQRIARISSYLASQLGLGDEQILLLRAAAPMHDVGKIAIPERILIKPGPLSAQERVEMERHTEVGYQLLAGSESELLQMAARIALTHHEWFDGSGYPRGLEGEEIPVEGRIVAVADVFDALLSDRPYRPAMSIDEAVEVIREGCGTHFDPEVAEALLEHLEDVLDLRG
jgi:putative two-component system response regulator